MKPFLFAVARPPGAIAQDEHDAILRYGNLLPHELERYELDQSRPPLPDLARYSGIIISGSPYGYLEHTKSDAHKRTEENALRIAQLVLSEDFPTLGLCYGLQILAVAGGGTLTHAYPEDMNAHRIVVNDAGRTDPLTSHLPPTFMAYAAHSESIEIPPRSLVTLGRSTVVPIQLARIGQNIYGTQHHPEIGTRGIELRINHYVGVYFTPEEHASVLRSCLSTPVEHGMISAFTSTYAAEPAYTIGDSHGIHQV